jgi:hypothetical protein
MSKVLNPEFQAEYESESDWANQHGVTARTVRRYRRAGLPHLRFGGHVYIHKRGAREWLAGCVKRPVPVRARRRGGTPEMRRAPD